MCSFFSSHVTFPLILATCSRLSSMTPYPPGFHAQGNGIDRRKFLRRVITPGDEIAIFFNVRGQLVRGRISSAHLRHNSKDDDIASGTITINNKGKPGGLLLNHQDFGVCTALMY